MITFFAKIKNQIKFIIRHAIIRNRKVYIFSLLVFLAVILKLFIYSKISSAPLDRAMCQWDCGWYLSIIRNGYDQSPRFVANCCWQANWAFFPLMPATVSLVSNLSNKSPEFIGVLVASASFLLFVLLGARLRRATRDETDRWLWPALMLCWPFSFYFHTIYTEALFAMLALAVLVAAQERRMLAAGLLTALLTATRPIGVLMVVVIFFLQIGEFLRARSWRNRLVAMMPVIVAPAGLIAFMTFLYFKVGDPLAFQKIQSGWGRNGGNPVYVLFSPLFELFAGRPDIENIYYALWGMLGFAAGIWLLLKRRLIEAWLCVMPIIMALSSGALISMPRFVSTNPAFLLAVCDLMFCVKSKSRRIIILLIMFSVQMFMLTLWWSSPRFLM
jgi:hypothetical protein